MAPPSIDDQLPLTEATFFILLSLAHGPNHGYGMMKDVEDLSHGRITLGTGTLYGAIKRLLDQGWIARSEAESESGGRERKAYTLTDLGRRILAAETDRLQSLASAGRTRLRQSSGG